MRYAAVASAYDVSKACWDQGKTHFHPLSSTLASWEKMGFRSCTCPPMKVHICTVHTQQYPPPLAKMNTRCTLSHFITVTHFITVASATKHPQGETLSQNNTRLCEWACAFPDPCGSSARVPASFNVSTNCKAPIGEFTGVGLCLTSPGCEWCKHVHTILLWYLKLYVIRKTLGPGFARPDS